ncbi:uncharacterized protein LOC123560554 [Mercenaria mercenaria]|uniref:uncharacterized protein LOC123560554 n=1 Tax=Mercenaria mercenaria TaxID=6596 RepID=UPI00234EE2F0|nr:uncharacterized protein LOC123560554 [Mercenaria mercenaria]
MCHCHRYGNTQELLIPRARASEHERVSCATDDHAKDGVRSNSDTKPLSAVSDNQQTVANPSTSAARFGDPMSEQQIREKNVGAVPKKTRALNEWSVKVWVDWARHRNAQPVTVYEPGYPIPEDIGLLDDAMLNYWGQRFIMEIKRQDGADHPPNTLHQLVCGLQRYLRNVCGKLYINFIKEGTQFNDFRKSLDTRMKELYAAGVGIKRSSSDPVTMSDEIRMWEIGVFNSSSATGLSNAVFYYNGKLFGFRGFQEHINCQATQFEILEDKEQNLRYILFTPGQRKNSQGGLKGRKFVQEPVRHYEQPDRQHNLVELYERYLALIPRAGPMYRQPLDGVDENNNPKFSAATISHNGIKSMMKRFFTEAGIDTNDSKITNHSARVSLCTTLYNKNFADKALTSRSKHRSNAVQAYQREQFDILNGISDALEPELKNPKVQVKGDGLELKLEKPKFCVTETVSSAADEKISSAKVEQYSRPATMEFPVLPSSDCHVDDGLVIHVPNCVKNLVIVKSDEKK